MMDTATAARAVAGHVIGANVRFTRVVTDTRKVAPGDLFVALPGGRFDGHDFVPVAFEQGAVAALVADHRAAAISGNLIAAPDSQRALLALAAHWRAQFGIPVIVVVGSNGKTTVKEMLAAILREHFGASHVLATEGNLNNAIGLPLTLLRLRSMHRVAVIELGMNHRGETAELAAVARPTVALVNNAQREHQEFMHTVGWHRGRERRRRVRRRLARSGAGTARCGRGRIWSRPSGRGACPVHAEQRGFDVDAVHARGRCGGRACRSGATHGGERARRDNGCPYDRCLARSGRARARGVSCGARPAP